MTYTEKQMDRFVKQYLDEELLKDMCCSPETLYRELRKRNIPLRGKPFREISLETRKKISVANKGKKKPASFGKHLSKINMGKKHRPESIEKMRLAKIGKKHSEATKLAHSQKMKGRRTCPYPISKETKKKIRVARLNQSMPLNGAELRAKKMLDSLGIEYELQKPMFNMCVVDFYIPDRNLVLEIDGDFWHANGNYPAQVRNMKYRTNKLLACMFHGVRFSAILERDLNKKNLYEAITW